MAKSNEVKKIEAAIKAEEEAKYKAEVEARKEKAKAEKAAARAEAYKNATETCPRCKGDGKHHVHLDFDNITPGHNCPNCEGEGRVAK